VKHGAWIKPKGSSLQTLEGYSIERQLGQSTTNPKNNSISFKNILRQYQGKVFHYKPS